MTISVVIPTHNRRDGLRGLLADLRAQENVPAPVEVMVVASSEGEDVADIIDEARAQGQDVHLVMTENAIGQKRNDGAHRATGELLVFFDDDMRLDPGVLAAHAAAHEKYPETVICGSVSFPREWVRRSNYYRFKDTRHLNARSAKDGELIHANTIVTMNLSVPAALFQRLGGFDTQFRRYGGEDVELGFRVVRAGVPMRLCLDADAWHTEVQLDVVGYCRKLYENAYYGTPRVLAKNPEAASVPTWKWTETDLAVGLADRALRGVVGWLARPALVRDLARLLRATDGRKLFFWPLAFKALTILAQRVAADDRRAGRDPRPGLFQ